ncbi:MAG: thiol reductase thioredoxin [Bacteroidales bacterium]|nr:thiol reductase thioredoxin [Bacteroidales bacterium]
MKKLISISIGITFLVFGCNSQTNNKETIVEESKEIVKPILLTKQMFLDEIMDYESNPNEWIYKGELPGLVDFYADWCAPCRITSPIIEDLAQEYAGKIRVYKIDIQKEQELAAVFGVRSIPTFLFIPMDDTPVMSSGIAQTPEQTKEMFRRQIDEILLQ